MPAALADAPQSGRPSSKHGVYLAPTSESSAHGNFAGSGKTPRQRFKVSHATGTRVLKGEDVLFIEPLPFFPEAMMFMVCDGHSGVEAANFVAQNFHHILSDKLFLMPPTMPDPEDTGAVEAFAERLRRFLCETFVSVDNAWTELGHLAGTTVSVVLVMDYLVTVANTGDSEGVLDTGCSLLEITESHRIQTHEGERQRLKNAGCQIAQLGFHLQGPAKPGDPGVGPLRIWPGGLCVSRSVGDIDVGPEIVPYPHIKQLILPKEGCRVIVASDGLWDVLTLSKAVKLVRSKPTQVAASALIDAVLRDQRFMDDTTVIVVDILPPDVSGFPAVALQAGLHPLIQQQRERTPRPKGGLCGCLSRPAVEEPDSRHADGPGRLHLFADVDCLEAYPPHMGSLARQSRVPFASHAGSMASRRTVAADYTVHASRNFFAPGGNASSAGGTNHSLGALPLTPPASAGQSAHGSEHGGGSTRGGLQGLANPVKAVGITRMASRVDPLTPATSFERGEVDAAADAALTAMAAAAAGPGPMVASANLGVGFGRVFDAGATEKGAGGMAGTGRAAEASAGPPSVAPGHTVGPGGGGGHRGAGGGGGVSPARSASPAGRRSGVIGVAEAVAMSGITGAARPHMVQRGVSQEMGGAAAGSGPSQGTGTRPSSSGGCSFTGASQGPAGPTQEVRDERVRNANSYRAISSMSGTADSSFSAAAGGGGGRPVGGVKNGDLGGGMGVTGLSAGAAEGVLRQASMQP